MLPDTLQATPACSVNVPCSFPVVPPQFPAPLMGTLKAARRLPHPTTQHVPSGSLVFPDPVKPLDADANMSQPHLGFCPNSVPY